MDYRDSGAHRESARFTGQMPQSAHGLSDHAKSRLIPIRAILAETGDTQHD